MEDQPHRQPLAAATQKHRGLFSARGLSTTEFIRVVTLVLLSGVLLLLVGITLAGTVIGLAVTTPFFVLFSPVLIPAGLTIGLTVTGFFVSVALALTGLYFFLRINTLGKRMRVRHTISGGEYEDARASTSLTLPEGSDTRPSAAIDNGKKKTVMVVGQHLQQNENAENFPGKKTILGRQHKDGKAFNGKGMSVNLVDQQQQNTIPDGQHKDAKAYDSSTSSERSDSRQFATIDNGEGMSVKVVDQQQLIIPGGQHKDAKVSNHLTSLQESDSRQFACADNGKRMSVKVVDQQQQSIPGGQHKDAKASNSLTSSERSDSGQFASVDNGKGMSIMAVDQQQQSALRKANDLAASSSSAISIESNKYDVFLSFRGLDTRTKFTDHLYQRLIDAGINVFRDDDELPKGENLGPNLLHAIKNSKISIPIFSQRYPSSKWCLQELAAMVECMKSGRHDILPIYYEVEPSDVRHQRGIFGEVFMELGKKFVKEDIDKWTQALREAASLKGWTSTSMPEGELVKLVMSQVLKKLKTAFHLVVTEKLVGIDNAVDEVLRLLDNPSATKIVSIHGMGGIGKTTLAKFVYNKLLDKFQHHSYIANIRSNNILSLQNQLIHDILKTKQTVSTIDKGIKILESRCTGKKVLILLDDVDHKNQLEELVGKLDWFEVGSKIIITTRKKSILNDDAVNRNYELKEIDQSQALMLFSRNAFLKNSPPPDFAPLCHDIISTTGRLPLALKVIGSYLYGKDQEFWQSALKKLKEVPHKDVQEKLRISYDALEHEEKQIFLDIACFFIGTDVRIASYMWKACRLHPLVGIENLSFMSLIKIADNHELRMHDQLRDLGRRIASQGEPMEGRRLWAYEKALEDKETRRKIEALSLEKDDSSKFMEEESYKIFKRLSNLQFLHLREVPFAGEFKLLSRLRWLKLERCPDIFKATSVHLKELLILDLSGGYISQNWEGWSLIKMEGLKVLNLSWCSELKSTPCLSGLKSLERLILRNCENLEEIHHSIGDVKCLVSLDLRCCGSLVELPEQLGELIKLEELLVEDTDIREIPQCIRSLEKLKTLSAVGCRLLTKVPSSISHLVRLSTLNLNACKKLKEIPVSIGALGDLERLSLERCYTLRQIPSSIGKLKKLRELDLSSTRIKELPESIGELDKLEILRISQSEIEMLPSSIGRLQGLRELDASGCHKLKEQFLIHEGGLSSLRTLRLARAKFPCLPDKLSGLSSLVHLDLLHCRELQSVPEPPSSLSFLELTCQNSKIPSLSKLSYLKELTLHSCMSLQSIPELPSCIRKLRVWKCPNLEGLPDLSKLEFLSELELLQCNGLQKLDGLEALKSLRKLDISTSTDLSNLKDFEDLESLRYLDGQSYDGKVDHLHAIGGLDQLESLEVLNISARKHIRRLDLQQSNRLRQLIVKNCESLIEIHCHSEVLEYFDSDGCKSLTKLPDILPKDRP